MIELEEHWFSHVNWHMVKLMTHHLFEALSPSFHVLLLPVHLKISHLDMGIQDEANGVDAAFIENLVPLAEIVKAGLECRNNLHILRGFDHMFPPLHHRFKDREHMVNSGLGGM
jgi:hypothetical protein